MGPIGKICPIPWTISSSCYVTVLMQEDSLVGEVQTIHAHQSYQIPSTQARAIPVPLRICNPSTSGLGGEKPIGPEVSLTQSISPSLSERFCPPKGRVELERLLSG